MSAPEFEIRPALKSDEGFVATGWVGTLRASSRASRQIPAHLHNSYGYELVRDTMPRCSVSIASPPGDAHTCYGFAAVEVSSTAPPTVHMVYVLRPFRRFGIATKLLEGVASVGTRVSCWSQDFNNWIFEKYPGLTHVPLHVSHWERSKDGERSEDAA